MEEPPNNALQRTINPAGSRKRGDHPSRAAVESGRLLGHESERTAGVVTQQAVGGGWPWHLYS